MDSSADAAEESFVDFKCPYCGTTLSFPKDSARLAEECLNCLEVVIVPPEGSEVGGKLPIPITTPRLVLRRFQPDDWKDLTEFLAEGNLPRYRPNDSPLEEQAIRWLQEDARTRLTQPHQSLCLAIVLQPGSKLVGFVDLWYFTEDHRQGWVSIFLRGSCCGQGYATEAIRGVLGLCFVGLGLHRVTTSCDSENAAARRLFERVGMRCEGEFLQDKFRDGQWVSTVWFAMLREEYRA